MFFQPTAGCWFFGLVWCYLKGSFQTGSYVLLNPAAAETRVRWIKQIQGRIKEQI